MKGAFRQSMGWLHIWAGLVAGWVSFFIFLTGTAGYFDTEIDRWMQPERPIPQAELPMEAAVAAANRHLMAKAPEAGRWFIGLPGYRAPETTLIWRALQGSGGTSGRVELDPVTGEQVRGRATGGGQFLYQMHYNLHYLPVLTANWIVGICTMLMLVAFATGVIVHKRIFRDFFTFRAGIGQRAWLDIHNVLGVLALPFHLMITYSGLIFFAYLYMAPVIEASYGDQADARGTYFDELSGRDRIVARAGSSAPLAPIGPVLRRAESEVGNGAVLFINIYNPGDANARIVVTGGAPTPTLARTHLEFDGVTGDLLRMSDRRSAPFATYQTVLGLHEGLFAGPVLRWLYFLSGLMGTAMIGAGLVLWTAKRRDRIGGSFGFRLVERLNVGTIVGLPIAVAAYFWANRLIPVDIEGRAAWEAHAMFIVWASILAHAFVRPPARGWMEQLWIATAAFGLLPLVNALTTDRHLGVTLPAGVWELAGFDLTMLAFGLAFACAAWRTGRRWPSDLREAEAEPASTPSSPRSEAAG